MNSYNENLRATVFDSLQEQEAEKTKLTAQLDAAKSTLYYAQGAVINTDEKLANAITDMGIKSQVKGLAVDNANLSTNLLASATQEQTYMDLSVTNAATGAANVQIAANAILKLSSDIAGISSILQAADYGEDIQTNAATAKENMQQTASDAEIASRLAMSASTYTAEVSYKKVQAQAIITNTNIDSLLTITSDEFTKATDEVAAQNVILATDNKVEKVAEGIMTDLNVDCHAAISAYSAMNDGLNLNLRVDTKANLLTAINFDTIKSPFPFKSGSTTDLTSNPVDIYYAITVKAKNKSTFTLANAEYVLQQTPGILLSPRVLLPTSDAKPAVAAKPATPAIPAKPATANSPATPAVPAVPATPAVPAVPAVLPGTTVEYDPSINTPSQMTTSIVIGTTDDSDGEKVELGQDYVTFVFAVYKNSYKKLTNNFDEFLSAPSESFTIVNMLEAPTVLSVDFLETPAPNGDIGFFDFQMERHQNEKFDVEYRCMLLPRVLASEALMTNETLKATEILVEDLEANKEAEAIKEQLEQLTLEIETDNDKVQVYEAELLNLANKLDKDGKGIAAGIAKANTTVVTKKMTDLKAGIKTKTTHKETLEKTLEESLKISADNGAKVRFGFFFDTYLAEKVSSGNYNSINVAAAPSTSEAIASKAKSILNVSFRVNLPSNTTDNFGSPIDTSEQYIPVVLVVSNAEEVDQSKFVSALSEINPAMPTTIVTKSIN